MAKKEDSLLNEIDAFIEEEKKPKRKRRTKAEIEVAKEAPLKPKKRGRKKKVEEVTVEAKEEVSVEDIVEEEMNNVSVITEDTEEIEEVTLTEETKEVPIQEVVEEPEEDEDIYLTKSFQPIKKKRRLKRSVIKFFKIMLLLAVLIVLIVFGFNKIKDYYESTRPINIYKAVIDGVSNEATSLLRSIPVDNYKFEVNVDTNMNTYNYLNNNTFGYGFNVNGDKYQDYIYYVDNSEEVGVHTLIDGEKMYKKYTSTSSNPYTVVAYMDENRTTNENNPQHVINKKKTAQKLSEVLDMTEEKILSKLNKENVYQVYLKTGVSETEKREIESLELPGIEFIETDVSDLMSDGDVYKTKYEESELRNLINDFSVNYGNLDNIITENAEIIKDILKEEYIEVKDDELTVNGQNLEVKCLELEFTDDIISDYIKELSKNTKLLNMMSDLLDKDSDATIKYIDSELHKLIGSKINLYITSDYKIIGFDYEVDGFRDMYLYLYEGSYDISIKFDKYVNKLLSCLGIEVNNANSLNLGIEEDSKAKISVDDKDKFSLVFKELRKDVISFEYKNSSSTKVMDVRITKDNIVLEYKNDNGKYFDMDIKVSKNEYSVMNLSDVVTSSKKVNEAGDNFYSEMNRDQKDTYNLINDIVYGELS